MNYDTRHNVRPVERRAVRIAADDGVLLDATWFEPDAPRGAVLVVPAMATPARYYAAFAAWLADQGFRALTFDFRGTGNRAAMRAERGDLMRWVHDARDVLDHVVGAADGLPVSWVGHSLGGQILPFVAHHELERAVTVASGTGWWRLNSTPVRWRTPLLWWGLGPVSTRLFGYYPGGSLRLLGDLPPNVMRQWRRWCLHRDYLAVDVPDAAERYAAVKAPIMSLSFTDDHLMSADSVRDLHDRYTNADQVRQRYSPAQLDVEHMGHHGFFRARHAGLWGELVLPYLAAAS